MIHLETAALETNWFYSILSTRRGSETPLIQLKLVACLTGLLMNDCVVRALILVLPFWRTDL